MVEVARISGGRGGFEVQQLFANGEYGMAIVEGTAYNGDFAFARGIVHVARLVDGRLVEYWDNPFDQYAEDEFWTAATADRTN
jgi:hypothetical protein